jgi:Family of unknown function (DUF6406)
MKTLLLLAALMLRGCPDDHDERFDPPRRQSCSEEVVLRCGVVPTLGDTRVGIGDVYPRTFLDANGHPKEGLSVTLNYLAADGSERTLAVGEGTVFEMGGAVWRVTKIKTSPHGGAVVERVGPPVGVSGAGGAPRSRSRDR